MAKGKKLEVSYARFPSKKVDVVLPANIVEHVDRVCDKTLASRGSWFRDAALMRLKAEGAILDDTDEAAA